MSGVKLREGETIEEALRRFKRDCEREGILQEIRRREYYETPAMKRKRKLQEAKRRLRKRMRYRR